MDASSYIMSTNTSDKGCSVGFKSLWDKGARGLSLSLHRAYCSALTNMGDRDGTVVKVLCSKPEGR